MQRAAGLNFWSSIDEDVDAAKSGRDLLSHRADRSIIIDICRDAEDAAGIRLLEFAYGSSVDVGRFASENGDGAFGKEFLGAGLTDAAATTGNDRYFVFKPEIQVALLKRKSNPCPRR